MATNPLYLLSGLMTLGLAILLIYYIRQKFMDRDEPEDKPIFENYMPQYAKGHTDGIIEYVEQGDERTKVIFSPRDNKQIRLNKKKGEKIKPITIFFEKRLFDSHSETGFSGHRQKAKGFPPSADLLPEGLKNTKFGRKVAEMINNEDMAKTEMQLLELSKDNLIKLAKETKGLDIVKTNMDMRDSIERDVRNNVQSPLPPRDTKEN